MTQRVEPGPVERNSPVASSGALLYEAAKQCVNAVANLRGRDPKGNQEKLAEINSSHEQFVRNFTTATDFIGEMLAMYRSIRQSQQG